MDEKPGAVLGGGHRPQMFDRPQIFESSFMTKGYLLSYRIPVLVNMNGVARSPKLFV